MKKFLKVIYYIIFALLISIALLLAFSFFPIAGNYRLLTVLSGSMEPAIKTGSIVVVKPADDYKISDIITFGQESKTETPTTHRIFDIRVDQGRPIYITKGDANNSPDSKEILSKEIIGKVLFSIPYVGYAVAAAKKPIGFILIIIIPAIIIITDELRKVWQEVKKLKNKKKDKEQDRESQKLKKEVEELKKSRNQKS
jgi:signal peptidase